MFVNKCLIALVEYQIFVEPSKLNLIAVNTISLCIFYFILTKCDAHKEV